MSGGGKAVYPEPPGYKVTAVKLIMVKKNPSTLASKPLPARFTACSRGKSLRTILGDIHAACVRHGEAGGGYVDYVKGTSIAGFKKVADATLAFGVV